MRHSTSGGLTMESKSEKVAALIDKALATVRNAPCDDTVQKVKASVDEVKTAPTNSGRAE